MSVTVLGNHSKASMGHGVNGNGVVNNVPAGLGWLSVTGSDAGDEHVVQLGNLMAGELNLGVFFQSEAGASVEFTLFNPAMATDPDPEVNASVLWGNTLAVPAGGAIVQAPLVFTCCKITFTAPGTVYIGVR